MTPLHHAREKVQSAVTHVQELRTADFPHIDAQKALAILEAALADLLKDLDSALTSGVDPSLALSLCGSASNLIEETLEAVGLIVNSTSIRNAFEVHEPLLGLAKDLIGPDAQLVLSFEWKYIPFTYPQNLPSLPKFVIIGLPASESTNALILPATGHELGHSIWMNGGYEEKYNVPIQKKILEELSGKRWDDFTKFQPITDKADLENTLGKTIWGRAYTWAMSQSEEVFCDLIGLHIFGRSYLHAFEYLVAPDLGDYRSEVYPSLSDRASFLVKASAKFGVEPPDNYEASFAEEQSPFDLNELNQLLLEVADTVTLALFDELYDEVIKFFQGKPVTIPQQKDWALICDAFRLYVPAVEPRDLAQIMNAAWEVYLDADYMKEFETGPRRRVTMLNELVLKSMEVLEMRRILER